MVFQLNFYFAQYWLLQSMVCTMIDVQTNSITAEFKWKPWENTIAYYEFNSNLLDSSWNNRNLSAYTWSFSYWTASWWWKYVQLSSSNTANNLSIPINFDWYTVSWFVNFWEIRSSGAQWIVLDIQSNDWFPRFRSWNNWINSYCWWSHWAPASINTRYYLVCVIKNKIMYCYINGELKFQDNVVNYSWTLATFVLNWISDKSRTQYRTNAKLWELIIENAWRTWSEITKYFNQMKNKYWIS